MIMADKKMPPIAQLKGRQLGRILIKMGRIRRAEVHEALEIQKEQRRPIGSILVELGHITKEDLNIALAAQVGMELIDIGGMDVPPEVIALVPQPMATTYKVVPYEFDPEQNLLSIAMDSPDNFHATDDMQTLLGFRIKASIADEDKLQTAIDRYYPEGGAESMSGLIDEISGDEDLSKLVGRGESIDLEDLREAAEANPVKKLLNLVLLQAIRDKASDIHFRTVRGRVQDALPHRRRAVRNGAAAQAHRAAIASPREGLAKLDIAERRLPQDGRIELTDARQPHRPARRDPADHVRRERASCVCSTGRTCRSTSTGWGCATTTCRSSPA
jgi:type IV pilus assembly protein PilB